MTTLGWIIITIFGILLLIFISFFLWFSQKKRHLLFEIYKQLEIENEEFINNKLPKLELKEVKVKITLQPEEQVFTNESAIIYLYHRKKKTEYHNSSKYVIPFPNGLNVGYGNGKSTNYLHQVPFQNGHIFVTNKRILIINDEITTDWDLNSIDNIELAVFRINNAFYQGFYLYTEEKCFMVIVRGLTIPYTIYKVWKNVK